MELSGWSSYEMVLRYAHLASDHLSHAVSRLDGTNLAHPEKIEGYKIPYLIDFIGGPGRTRTYGQGIMSRVLSLISGPYCAISGCLLSEY